MRKIHIMSALLCGVMATASAQSLKPVYKSVDCGQMLFRTSTAVTVELQNTSQQPVTLKGVDTGCGCTVAEYDKGEIMPGANAKVKLVFDCKQLGYFNRTVRVTDSTSDTPVEFTVNGQVVTKLINYSGEYPYKLGLLLANEDNIEFDDVNKGQRLKQEINIMNPTGQNMRPTALRLPPYLSVEMYPEVLGPKQKGVMYVTLKSRELNDYGLNQTTFYLGSQPSDKVTPEKEITVSAVLLPQAVAADSPLRRNAPVMTMSAEEIDMTVLAKKSKVKGEITISNTGKSVLEIRKMQMFTMGLEVKLGKSVLQPGESTTLKVTARAKEMKKVKRRPRILMITNDPDRQKVVVYIKK